MLAGYDTSSQCLRHPGQPIGGICALCLKERLTRLACTRCGGLGSSRVATISCSCTPLEAASKPVQDKAKEGHSRTIASLIESDIENSKRLSQKVEQDERSDRDSSRLRRSRSVSLGKSSRYHSHRCDCRSARESWRKTGFNEGLEGDIIVLETNNAFEKSDGPIMTKVPKPADADEKDIDQGSIDDAATIWCEEEDSSTLLSNAREEKRGLTSGSARLTKAKSTGWVLSDRGKASPSCSGGRIPATTKNVKGIRKFGIFRRRNAGATTALRQGDVEMCRGPQGEHCISCAADSKKNSCSDIAEPKASCRLVKLIKARNSNSNQNDPTPACSSSGSNWTGCSLTATEGEGTAKLRRCTSQESARLSWSKSLLSPWLVLGRLAKS